MQPQFGFSVSPGPIAAVAAEAGRAERAGYDRIGIWDSPALFREPWTALTATAIQTSTMRLGTWVTNPVTRHPTVLAASAASVEEVAPGRTYIGIGSGGTAVWNVGLKSASLADLEHYVLATRELLERGVAEYRGATIEMPWAAGHHVPIILSGHGPKSLRLAGRIGDGVVIGLGITPDVVSQSLALIAEGAAEVGRTLADIDVWFTCFWFVDEVPGAARERGAWACTSFASHFAHGGVEGKWVPPELAEGILELGRAYDFSTHGNVPDEQQQAYVQLAEERGVLDYLRSRFVLCGTPNEVEQQIRTAIAAGATQFDGAIDAELPEHEERISAWAEHVLPRFRGKSHASVDATDGS